MRVGDGRWREACREKEEEGGGCDVWKFDQAGVMVRTDEECKMDIQVKQFLFPSHLSTNILPFSLCVLCFDCLTLVMSGYKGRAGEEQQLQEEQSYTHHDRKMDPRNETKRFGLLLQASGWYSESGFVSSSTSHTLGSHVSLHPR